MKNRSKLIVALAAALAIVLVIFLCFKLFRKNDSVPPQSGNLSQGSSSEDSSSGDVSSPAQGNSSGSNSFEGNSEGTSDNTPNIKEIDCSFSDFSFALTVDTRTYEEIQEENSYTFKRKKDDNCYLKFIFFKDSSASVMAQNFLKNYIETDDVEYAGLSDVSSTGLKGEYVIGSSSSQRVCAWLVEQSSGVFAIVTSCSISSETVQSQSLTDMLNTLKIS